LFARGLQPAPRHAVTAASALAVGRAAAALKIAWRVLTNRADSLDLRACLRGGPLLSRRSAGGWLSARKSCVLSDSFGHFPMTMVLTDRASVLFP
jgi:hypothetical protein